MGNNLFEFATGELSQDAFICWCANWFNDDSKPRLKEMSVELMRKFTGVDDIKSVMVCRQFSQDVYIDDKKLALKIDVLLIINDNIAVIVEDKTYTSEHDNQIQRYVDGIKYLASNAKKGQNFYGVDTIRTVFLKTGFMYDEDKCVKSDVIISGPDFLNILSKYSGYSEILDSYIANLENILQWYVYFGNYEGTEESFWNIANHQIAQYNLMRDIFPETMWTNRESKQYKVRHGSSRGRPWTEMQICERYYAESSDYYSVFWRIDTDGNGPYISLRLYEWFDKNNEEKKSRHRRLYEAMSGVIRRVIDNNSEFVWEDVYPGYRGNYKESSLIHIKLKDKLLCWQNEKEKFIGCLNELTKDFVEESSKIVE